MRPIEKAVRVHGDMTAFQVIADDRVHQGAVRRLQFPGMMPWCSISVPFPTLQTRLLFEGKRVDVGRNVSDGFNTGCGTLCGIDAFLFHNECLRIANAIGQTATGLDRRCFLDSETADPVACARPRRETCR